MLATLVVPALCALHAGTALAQGVTTAAVRGTVRIQDGSDPVGARVSVRNLATGFVVEVEVRRGRFLVQGLEVGGPYRVTLRRIGARVEQRDIGYLSLGEPYELDLVLEPSPVQLDSLVVTSLPESAFPASNAHGGTGTAIPDSLIHRLPTLNRDIYDFVRLVPQISTRVGLGSGGISGGGVGFRFNQFLTNGVPERSLAGGQPPEFAGGKSLPFEAVGEYQVLLAPFDVRHGDFAGAAVNSVTRSGTNQFQGSLVAQFRNDALARTSTLPYERGIFGFSLSGPIARDRAHFLIASEVQRLTSPMAGPFVGQPADADAPVPVREADLGRLETIMRSYGLQAGSGGAVRNRNPLRNVFARLDAALPEANSRAALWLSDADGRNLDFDRGARDTTFALSSQASTTAVRVRTVALQVHTSLSRPGGGHNEVLVSHRTTRFGAVPDVLQPIVAVAVPGAIGGGIVSVITGTPGNAQGGDAHSRSINLRDNLTLPVGRSHIATFGAEIEWFRLQPGGVPNRFGSWSFLSLDSLQAGLPDRYDVIRDLGGGAVPLTGSQGAAYVGDHWQLGGRVALTFGVRADMLQVDGRPPHNPAVDSIFGRRTDELPSGRVHWSPRAGFTWSPDRAGRNRIRGGAGIFTGRPPLAWLQMPLLAYGFGTGSLRCGSTPADQGPAPAFDPEPLTPPVACAGGSGATPPGDVELVDRRLRMARVLRGVLAWDRRLPGGLLATAEALFTRNLSDFIFVNLNLEGPQSTDRRGRVLYGAIAPNGRASPALRSNLPGVIDVQNVSANHSMQLSTRLERGFSGGSSLLASYTWTRVRDVQTPLRVNNRGQVNWSSRAVSGRHDDLSAGISLNDVPHRIVLAGIWRSPWQRWTTELSILYVGESGSPFTYRAFGVRGLGDLNADGSNLNDPIYVPRNATDPDEIAFAGESADPGADPSAAAQAARILAQQAAFERFIEESPCLRRQRGRILERNSCREPWSHTSVVTLRQRVPVTRRGLEFQLDAFNLLNLVNGSWGMRRVSAPALLEHVGQAADPAGTTLPVFRFTETASPWTVVPAESAFQLQVGVAYRF